MTPRPDRAPNVSPLQLPAGRVTVPLDDRRPRTAGTVRALTAALAPHLLTADPELHGLAATLLSAQQDWSLSVSAAPGAGRDEVRRRYSEAAHAYVTALERRGLAAPPGLAEAEHWLGDHPAPPATEPTGD